ncbi:hypothetical protein [Hydrogenimonas sp. SS33]|uniref:hypothetical protein n=1 Tax=Hydrogenimonas leucolamina TaxID=2954236 RepID=UPI00336C0E9A
MEAITVCRSESGTLLRFDGETWSETTPKEAKKRFCAAMVPAELIRSHTFKVPIGTSEEKLSTTVEITMFEEGGLDLNEEYAIAYIRHPLDFESSWLVEAFAVESAKLHERFDALAKRTGHIDLLSVPYLAYEALYRYERADAAATELFLYLGESASYAVLCKEGRYIAHRTLPSLLSLATRAGVTVEVVEETLKTRGLEAERFGPDERLLLTTIQEEFEGIVRRIGQAVSHKRGIFGFGGVDTVLLDFGGAEIPGLWELLDGYGFEESRKGVVSCCPKLPAESQHEGVEALYLLAAFKKEVEAPNLTIFEKPTPFLRTHTGLFLSAVAAALLAVAGYGLYLAAELGEQQREAERLQREYDTARKSFERLGSQLKQEKAERDVLQKEVKRKNLELMAYDEAADAMMLIEDSKRRRRQMMRDVDTALAEYRLSATSLEQNGSKRMRVDILTGYSDRDRIAKFMKRLAEKGYSSVGTDAIRLDKDVYRSSVEIVR